MSDEDIGGITPLAASPHDSAFVWDLIEAAPDGIVITDEAGRILLVNRQTEQMFARDRSELLGQSVEILLPEDSRAIHTRHRARYAAEPRTRPMGEGMVLRGARRDGSTFPVEVSLSPLRTGGLLRVMASVRDVSERIETERELAMFEDRERIAQDLHDTVIQRLFAVGMTLQATAGMIGDPVASSRIEAAVEDLDETIRELRATIFALEANLSPGGGLRRAILEVVGEQERPLGITPNVTFEGAVEHLDEDLAAQALPALREMLSNVARHARATTVHVKVIVTDEFVIRVIDNGVGIASGLVRGNGLNNLESRAVALGGSFVTSERPLGGTVAEWRVPLVRAV